MLKDLRRCGSILNIAPCGDSQNYKHTYSQGSRGMSQYKDAIYRSIRIPIIKIRQSRDHLIFTIEIPISLRQQLYIETTSGSLPYSLSVGRRCPNQENPSPRFLFSLPVLVAPRHQGVWHWTYGFLSYGVGIFLYLRAVTLHLAAVAMMEESIIDGPGSYSVTRVVGNDVDGLKSCVFLPRLFSSGWAFLCVSVHASNKGRSYWQR